MRTGPSISKINAGNRSTSCHNPIGAADDTQSPKGIAGDVTQELVPITVLHAYNKTRPCITLLAFSSFLNFPHHCKKSI